MVGKRRRPPQPSIDDTFSYILDVKKALHDEPAKYYEFLKLMIDVSADRIDEESGINGIAQLIKGHPKLLLVLSSFLPTAQITIPPEAETIILPKASSTMSPEASRTRPLKIRITSSSSTPQMSIPPEAKTITLPKANSTMSPEASRTRPLKLTIISSSTASKTIPPEAKTITLPKANSTMSPEASRTRPFKLRIIGSSTASRTRPPKIRITSSSTTSRTIPPNAERPTHFDEVIFMINLQTRFQRCDTHVVESFSSIMKMYREGKKSAKEVHEKVVDLLYYHEDLIQGFSRIFLKHGSFLN